MDDLAEKITELLSDPEIMNIVKEASGLSGPGKSRDTKKSEKESDEKNDNFPGFSPELIQSVMKLAPLFSSFKKEDKYTRFLNALKPLLSEKRQKKLESSSQILKLIKILPLLKNQGLF